MFPEGGGWAARAPGSSLWLRCVRPSLSPSTGSADARLPLPEKPLGPSGGQEGGGRAIWSRVRASSLLLRRSRAEGRAQGGGRSAGARPRPLGPVLLLLPAPPPPPPLSAPRLLGSSAPRLPAPPRHSQGSSARPPGLRPPAPAPRHLRSEGPPSSCQLLFLPLDSQVAAESLRSPPPPPGPLLLHTTPHPPSPRSSVTPLRGHPPSSSGPLSSP
ncbi:uncharacterized protein LOC110205958 [Phascolarctos cinereus]|uniref:Vegetative cell wall protein gp1-like n=1 Tax=Phascolarctos cinereus TaxID=38626 RepID=A0A6P5K0I3_PHACI|nr:vegetative cell wall protein gp1-like [Phascolarctos cinereus]